MRTPQHPMRVSTTRDDLRAAGFSAVEIDRLEKLRGTYPYMEFLDSWQELQRLRFLKWMISREPTPVP